MRVRGLGRLRRTAWRLRNKFVKRGLILMYHRVAALPSDPHQLCVTPQHFAEHLAVLAESCLPISLRQLGQALRAGEVPDQAVVVTFDDGYADNLYNAKPHLERFGIPATVFVTTQYLGSGREFWVDELTRLLLQPGTLPATLHLQVNGCDYHWELGEAAHYGEEDCDRQRGWNVSQKDDPSRRHSLYRTLYLLLCSVSERERGKILHELRVWGGADFPARPTHRPLSPDEVRHLVAGGHVEVGAHSVTHSTLSSLSPTEQRMEIEGSKTSLEEILGHPVTSFAYPYGQYTLETITLVRQAGFAFACSTVEDVIWRGTDCLQLPRVGVRDCEGEIFARRLSQWLRG